MNKQKALELSKEFITTTIFENKANLNLNKPFNAFFNDEILQNDTNLEILKSELNKLGYNISKTDNIHYWTISKLN